MGRQQYLIRLALGRSAFQIPEDDGATLPTSTSDGVPGSASLTHAENGENIQQYDSKGRPINPATESRNAEMRRAQNSILALVGVVEDRERREHSDEMKSRHMHEARQSVLQAENDLGDDLSAVIDPMSVPLEWWMLCLLKRCIVGFHHCRKPFSGTLRDFWLDARVGGLRGLYSAFLPGTVVSVVHYFSRLFFGLGVDHLLLGPLESSLIRMAPRKSRHTVFFAVNILRQAILTSIDLALLPLGYYAVAQQLGIAPARPLLPPLTSLLPWHEDSLHSFGWKGLTSVPFLSAFSSPAALLLMKSIIRNEMDLDEETPINPALTSFRMPSADMVGRSKVQSPAIYSDPLGWLLHKTHRLREHVLEWCGLVVSLLGPYDPNTGRLMADENIVLLESNGRLNRHRWTPLAHLPARFLATKFDGLFAIMLTLPFETMMLRAIATTYLTSTLPKSVSALQNAAQLYPVLSGGLQDSLQTLDGLVELGYYASKIGLCIAVKASMDVLLFGGIYRIVRRKGVGSFNWGSRDEARGIMHAPSPSFSR